MHTYRITPSRNGMGEEKKMADTIQSDSWGFVENKLSQGAARQHNP